MAEMTESKSLAYVTRMNRLIETKMKIKRDALEKLSVQTATINQEIVELQNICPHLVQVNHPRKIAEDDSYSVCSTCGKTI